MANTAFQLRVAALMAATVVVAVSLASAHMAQAALIKATDVRVIDGDAIRVACDSGRALSPKHRATGYPYISPISSPCRFNSFTRSLKVSPCHAQ